MVGRERVQTELGVGCKVVNSVFGRCFIFSIGMKCFSFGVFRRAVSRLYCSYIYIYIYIQQT